MIRVTLFSRPKFKMRVNCKGPYGKIVKIDGFRIIQTLTRVLNHDRVPKELRTVQDELKADVLRLLGGASAESLWDVLIGIVEKIEAMKITSSLGVSPWDHETRKVFLGINGACNVSGSFEIRGERFFFIDGPNAEPASREFYYWILYQTLKTGSFSRLRKCPACSTFFVAKDLKRKFCSGRCKDTYNNNRRAAEGYFTRKKRERKENTIGRAKRLLDSGWSVAKVQIKTGLSPNALRRAGLIP